MSTISRTMTEEEFLALPKSDDIERELIRGELRERPSTTTRAYSHSTVCARIVYHLMAWLVTRPIPRGSIISGEARVRLRRDPLTFVCVDIGYISAEARPNRLRKVGYVDGPPI